MPEANASVGTIRVVEISRHGGPEVLRLTERPRAPLAAGQVRVQVAAIGVNFADIMGRLGFYSPAPPPPYVPGFEVSGTVLETGASAHRYRAGDRVIVGCRFGGYASEVVADEHRVLALPAGWSFPAGAGFLATYGTAWHALITLGGIGPGDSVLIHAGAGGLGTAVIQLARHRGARVVACAGGTGKAAFCEEQGAHSGIDYTLAGWPARALVANGGRGFTLIVDSVMGRDFESWRELLAPMGHLVLVGAASFTPRARRNWLVLGWKWLNRPRLDLVDFISRNRTVSGFNILLHWDDEDYMARLGAALSELAAAGAVQPVLDRTFPFTDAAAAHEHVQSRRSRGKVVLTL